MSRTQPLVQFIVAGVQKGGTTALFDYLSEHPPIRMASVKETHFFDTETGIDWLDPDYGRYHELFDESGGAACFGEATPIYIYWPNALERIKRYNPDVRLVLLFRDPVERAYSHWKMEYARGTETEPFARCIRRGRSRVRDNPAVPGFHRVYSYVERGFYGQQLTRLYGLFGRDQVLVLLSDELKHAPGAALGKVCRFLGVEEPDARIAPRAVHVAMDIDYGIGRTDEDVAYLRALYREDTALFQTLTNLPVDGWMT